MQLTANRHGAKKPGSLSSQPLRYQLDNALKTVYNNKGRNAKNKNIANCLAF
jgi:hypothetical protein